MTSAAPARAAPILLPVTCVGVLPDARWANTTRGGGRVARGRGAHAARVAPDQRAERHDDCDRSRADRGDRDAAARTGTPQLRPEPVEGGRRVETARRERTQPRSEVVVRPVEVEDVGHETSSRSRSAARAACRWYFTAPSDSDIATAT